MFLLTYRDIRISASAGVILGIFEIGVFAALAIWILLSNTGDLNLQPFNPNHAPEGAFTGVGKGMVFAILAFIGFEAAAPLGEEAKHPRRTIPRAVVYSCLGIGLFYVLLSYAWVFGAGGVDTFAAKAGASGDPWRDARQGLLGRRLGARLRRDHQLDRRELERGLQRRDARLLCDGAQRHRAEGARAHAPEIQDAARRDHRQHRDRSSSCRSSWAGGGAPLNGFIMLATAATVVVIIVYMLVMLGSIRFYLTEKRAQFNVLLHLVFPLAGIVLFAFPLYYQYFPLPAYPYPLRRLVRARVDRCRDCCSGSSCCRRGPRRCAARRADLRRGRACPAPTSPTSPSPAD